MKIREMKCPKCSKALQLVSNGSKLYVCGCGYMETVVEDRPRGVVEYVQQIGADKLTIKTSADDY